MRRRARRSRSLAPPRYAGLLAAGQGPLQARRTDCAPHTCSAWSSRSNADPAFPIGKNNSGSASPAQNPGTTLAHPPVGRLPGRSGQDSEQSGGVERCGEAEQSLRQLIGGLHGGVVATPSSDTELTSPDAAWDMVPAVKGPPPAPTASTGAVSPGDSARALMSRPSRSIDW